MSLIVHCSTTMSLNKSEFAVIMYVVDRSVTYIHHTWLAGERAYWPKGAKNTKPALLAKPFSGGDGYELLEVELLCEAGVFCVLSTINFTCAVRLKSWCVVCIIIFCYNSKPRAGRLPHETGGEGGLIPGNSGRVLQAETQGTQAV